jgi:hypothetical protein
LLGGRDDGEVTQAVEVARCYHDTDDKL